MILYNEKDFAWWLNLQTVPLTNHRNNAPDISSSSTLTVLTQQLNPLHSPNSLYCSRTGWHTEQTLK